MSADSTVAFLGVRFKIQDADVPLLENRSHRLQQKARECGLTTYWGTFSYPESRSVFLFIGDKLGIIGLENEREVCLSVESLSSRVQETTARLCRAGISESPLIHVQWQPDA